MDIVTRITAMIVPSLDAMGYRVVLIKLLDRGRSKTLSIMAERTDDEVMSFDDCTDISRTVSALLDVEDPIPGQYNLEVMSPGIDRPLTRPEDFTRFSGFEAKVETMLPIAGRKRFRGLIEGVKGEVVTLAADGETFQIPFGQMKAAKLVLTDALMDAHIRAGETDKKKKTKA
ncbi:MAG: ribosome maturation factor RimP [Proteobacteria bacterium]|nr:ribosome maturation factor RimP [Pseudomonadota bacterium]